MFRIGVVVLFVSIFLVKSIIGFRMTRQLQRRQSVGHLFASRGPPASSFTDGASTTKSSKVLQSILGEMSTDEFFDKIWQKQPKIVSRGVGIKKEEDDDDNKNKVGDKPKDPSFDAKKMKTQPLEETIRQAWNVLTELMQRAPLLDRNEENLELPVVMMDGNVQRLEDVMERYGTTQTLFSAYLDGCSIVQNHADLISPWIAALCLDLQSIFPYVFAQTYLTPPLSQTLNPHADDRDVIVIQLLGQKEWSVYQDVPIPYPYPHEQVGKRPDLPVPPQVLNGPTSISKTLRPGDVLYIPRGHVHQAFSSDDLSLHITIAIATFDWTLGATVHRLTQAILMQDMESRKSMLPLHNREKAQKQLDRAMDILKREITLEELERNVMFRTERHLQMDDPLRRSLIQESIAMGGIPIQQQSSSSTTECVGPQAASRVTWNTVLRAATAEEKESVDLSGQVGMCIREDTKADVLAAASRFKDGNNSTPVSELRSLNADLNTNPFVCDLTLLAFARQAVSLGALAVVT
ncbi:cupin domain containing protein [Nitzschia inconspicua]|uniref:Bifunctional lysine-specific demethylase and histidyl-hydroxylase n=1 Tax=Nitzschia inconspicua TaxID=303405 RepID=A0A9K3PS75_9STRA|nr:cupin domain containing protein [Nitzschia inconspicua]